jgi:hypothetical protein
MSVIVEQFNANVCVTELLARSLENACKEVVLKCVQECASTYGFDAEEALLNLGLEKLVLARKAMAKKASGVKKEKTAKGAKEQSFPLPFVPSLVNKEGCCGLAYNHGLFTQCRGAKMENGAYCKKCQSQADKNASGKPDCLSVSDRLEAGLYEFKDAKGRHPIPYPKVLAKMKLTMESALEEAEKKGIELDEEHQRVPEKEKKAKSEDKKRGRPKKATTEVSATNVDDLFAKLTTDAAEEVSDAPKKAKLTDEEKAAKKAEMEKARAEAKAIKEAEKASQKAVKDAEREAKRAAEKAERESKRAAEKAEKEAKKAAEKAEKEAKKAAEKAEKEALAAQKKAAEKEKKTGKSSPKTAEAVAVVAPAVEAVEAPKAEAPKAEAPKAEAPKAEASDKVKVTLITIDGVQYYKTKGTNVVLDKTTQAELGTYDAVNKKIIPFPDDDELDVEEEEYESDSDN